jgi:hypothetical protein
MHFDLARTTASGGEQMATKSFLYWKRTPFIITHSLSHGKCKDGGRENVSLVYIGNSCVIYAKRSRKVLSVEETP